MIEINIIDLCLRVWKFTMQINANGNNGYGSTKYTDMKIIIYIPLTDKSTNDSL